MSTSNDTGYVGQPNTDNSEHPSWMTGMSESEYDMAIGSSNMEDCCIGTENENDIERRNERYVLLCKKNATRDAEIKENVINRILEFVTKISIGNIEYLFVEIPMVCKHVYIYNSNILGYVHHVDNKEIKHYGIVVSEIKDNYTFLCTTDTITEDIAKVLVGDYVMPLVEFANLLDNNNLDPQKTYAILQKEVKI